MENEIFETTPETEVQEQPIAQPVEETPVEGKKLDIAGMANSVADKAKELYNNKGSLIEKIKAVPKKLWIMAGAAIAALIAIIVAISLFTNTYKAPIKVMQKQANAKSYTNSFQSMRDSLNGIAKSEIKAIEKLYKKTDEYKDNIADMKEDFKDGIEELKDEYGKNYKITYKIEDKEKLEKEDLREMRDTLRDFADNYDELKDETNDYDSDDWSDAADEVGLSKANTKKLVKELISIGKICKKAKVTKGYELTGVMKLTGSELDEPQEQEFTIRVYKVNGRWVSESALNQLGYMAYSFG